MANKRNAALEALSGAAPADTPAAAPAPAGAGTENIVTLKPSKSAKATVQVAVYMPAKVARKFKEIAFIEDRKANDIYLEALDLYLIQQGHGGIKGVTSR